MFRVFDLRTEPKGNTMNTTTAAYPLNEIVLDFTVTVTGGATFERAIPVRLTFAEATAPHHYSEAAAEAARKRALRIVARDHSTMIEGLDLLAGDPECRYATLVRKGDRPRKRA